MLLHPKKNNLNKSLVKLQTMPFSRVTSLVAALADGAYVSSLFVIMQVGKRDHEKILN
jgi:hypothetical protein